VSNRNIQFFQTSRNFLGWLLFTFCSFESIDSSVHAQYMYAKIPPYDVTSGLAHNEVNDVVIDNDGFAWIATENGMSRYDGYNFINFNSKTHPAIFKDNRINDIEKKGNILYLLTEADGLIELQTENLQFTKLSNDKPLSLAFSNDTTAFLFNTGMLILKRNNVIIYQEKIEIGPKASILIYQGDLIVSANTSHAYRFNPNKPLERIDLPVVNNWSSGKLQLSKTYGVINSNGWRVFVLKGNTFVEHPNFVGQERISFFHEEDSGNILWIDKFRIPIVKIKKNDLAVHFAEEENIQYKSICRINETSFLIGSNQGLVQMAQIPDLSRKISDFKLVKYNEPIVRRRIVEHQNKRYYLGFPNILVENEKHELSIFSDATLSSYCGLIFNNQLYCTTEGSGLISFDLTTKKMTSHECNVLKLKGEHLNDLSVFSDSSLLITGENRIISYAPRRNAGLSFSMQPGTLIYSADQLKNSDLIYVGTNKGVFRMRLTQTGFEFLDDEKDLGYDARDVLVREEQNELWVASSKGILVLNLNDLKIAREYSSEHNVSDQKVTALIEDKNHCIWASTYNGFTVYNTIDGSIRFVSKPQGIYNHEYNYKSACLLQNGELVFGGLNAFEIINPNKLNDYVYANSFLISGIETIGIDKANWFSTYKNGTPITFQTGKESIRIYLANLDYQFGSGYSFQYSLDDKNWFNTEDKKWILLSDLTYGEYALKIRMYDPFGKMVEEKTIEVIAIAPFYVKTEFHIFLVLIGILTIALIAFILLRTIRIRSITKAKIAMDLHDESGTILTRLLLISKKSKFEAKEKEQIQNGLKEALYSFRTYLDSISNKSHSLQDLSDDLKEFITSACADGGLQFKFKMDFEKNYRINRELYRDVKLSVYEIVSNCLKHSQATSISIECKSVNKVLTLTISDNGICDLASLGTQKGNGIRNITNRAKRNNGFVRHYINTGETGLTTEIQLPIA
jgi:ligand-binding sensor domain-containing protein/two-component sensor histidine kinase